MADRAGYEMTANELAEAMDGLATPRTIRQWYRKGFLPSAYVWRAPSGRLHFKRKTLTWLLTQGALPAEPPPSAAVGTKPVRWDRAS
jgi:hypothetical protein